MDLNQLISHFKINNNFLQLGFYFFFKKMCLGLN